NADQQLARTCDFGAIVRKQYSSAGVFLNDRGPCDSLSRDKRYSPENGTINWIRIENDSSPFEQRGPLRLWRSWRHMNRRRSSGRQVRIDDFQREASVMISKSDLMCLVKCVAKARPVLRRVTLRVNRDWQ